MGAKSKNKGLVFKGTIFLLSALLFVATALFVRHIVVASSGTMTLSVASSVAAGQQDVPVYVTYNSNGTDVSFIGCEISVSSTLATFSHHADSDVGGGTVTTIEYTLTDGGPLDADQTVNGVIDDPVGPAVEAAALVKTGTSLLPPVIGSSSLLAVVAVIT